MSDANSQEETASQTVSNSEEANQERKLIEAVQNGDQKAFGKLVRLHQKRLFRFIHGILGSFDATEDIVQEAFVRAYKNIEKFRVGSAFYPWLSTIARNLAYNQIRKDEKKESLEKLAEKGFNPETTELGPLGQLLNDESSRRFQAALQAMPVLYRTVFVLRHYEEMDYAAIGSYLKIPQGTVDSRLYRARKFLMEQLKDLL